MGSGIGTSHFILFLLIFVFNNLKMKGLCGVLVSRFAKETYLTDYEDIVLEVLQDNVDLNKAAGIFSLLPIFFVILLLLL